MHVMVDIETMGTSNDAAIIAIGAVKYNNDGSGWDTFYQTVDLESSVGAGGKLDPSTVKWWLSQSKAAQNALLENPLDLVHTLSAFGRFFPKDGLFWGFGATFDNVIVRNAYKSVNMVPPWSYKNDRCFRTLVAQHPEVSWAERLGEHHNALDDALHQARHHLRIISAVSKLV